jgi:hypothetical protein
LTSAPRRAADKSIPDPLTQQLNSLRKSVRTDRRRLDQYASDIREVEQRIQRIEARNGR